MNSLDHGLPTIGGALARTLAWGFSAVAWVAATVIGGLVAIALAGGMVIMAIMATLLMLMGATAAKARRTARAQTDPDVIEARHVGGHSWVAYGWDGRG